MMSTVDQHQALQEHLQQTILEALSTSGSISNTDNLIAKDAVLAHLDSQFVLGVLKRLNAREVLLRARKFNPFYLLCGA